MIPRVIAVREGRAFAPNGTVATVLNVTYTVGPLGPFTLTTSPEEMKDGTALRKMTEFANTLGTLPGVNSL